MNENGSVGVNEPIILLGAPRSGTTWLQEMLAAHPSVASTQESKALVEYTLPLLAAWNRQPLEDHEAWRRMRFTGPACVLTEEEFRHWAFSLSGLIYRRALELKPGASVVVDKDPPNNLFVETIRGAYPNARFVHLIRDGRDVVASLIRAHHGWGSMWAPGGVGSGARLWSRHVVGARAAETASCYIEIRYEDLRTSPTDTLEALLQVLGIPAHRQLIEQMVTVTDVDMGNSRNPLAETLVWGGEVVRRGISVEEPESFVGKRRGDWKMWSSRARVEFEIASGGLLCDLGYEEPGWTGGSKLGREAYGSQGKLSQDGTYLWEGEQQSLTVHHRRAQPFP